MSARPSLIDPANGPTPHLVSCFSASISTLTSHRSSELFPLFQNLFLPHIPRASPQQHLRPPSPTFSLKSPALYPPQFPHPPLSSLISSLPLTSPQYLIPIPYSNTPDLHASSPPPPLPSPILQPHTHTTTRPRGQAARPPPSARTHPAFPALEPVIHHPRPGAVARGCTRGARRGRSRHYA